MVIFLWVKWLFVTEALHSISKAKLSHLKICFFVGFVSFFSPTDLPQLLVQDFLPCYLVVLLSDCLCIKIIVKPKQITSKKQQWVIKMITEKDSMFSNIPILQGEKSVQLVLVLYITYLLKSPLYQYSFPIQKTDVLGGRGTL